MLHRCFKVLRPDENQAFSFLGPATPSMTTLAKRIDRSIDHNSHSGNPAASNKFFCSCPLAAAPSEKLTRTDSRFVAASDRQDTETAQESTKDDYTTTHDTYPVMFAPQNRLLHRLSQQR
jgi:hypothetical protein